MSKEKIVEQLQDQGYPEEFISKVEKDLEIYGAR